jgi:hypothetical protein
MRSPLESNYSFSILSLKRSTRSLLLSPKRAIGCHFLQKRPFWTILIIQNLRNSRMNYLARTPIINFYLYSTPFSRIREEKVSGRKG